MGMIGKIISVAFIWYLVVLCVTASLVTIASLKSGLILSSLKMLISVLSNKAVLGSREVNLFSNLTNQTATCLSKIKDSFITQDRNEHFEGG